MKITGIKQSSGKIVPVEPNINVEQKGKTLRETDTGAVMAVKEIYGGWISPALQAEYVVAE
ncbi:hypothetical protein [Thalassolituus oleivorans]|uniref:hypothetical protein n=1 Tax=Thalassolituus oleivorans TaxID=187493 RepID=UPI0023F55786|nr:hypothetical protein [Thalassolituus oleivorans]|tara:strand:- start:13330 stop:13512 length:183 start_codon:yes stop_codon:yes gene_type:complete